MRKILLVLAFCPALLFSEEKTDWPMWRGGNYNGSGESPGAIPDNSGLKLAWKQTIGSGYSAIVIAENKVVTMGSDHKHDYVIALSEAPGKELWRTKIAETYPGHDGANDGPVSTPAIADERVFALGPRGQFLALNSHTGEQLWSVDLLKDFKSKEPHWGFTTSPLIYKNLVILAIGGMEENAIAAFKQDSGALVWTAASDTINYCSPILFDFPDREQIVFGGETYLYGLEPSTGTVLWQAAHGSAGFYRRIINPVVADEDKLFLTYRSSESKLVQIRRQSPDYHGDNYSVKDLWTSRHLKRNFNIPVYHNGYIYGFSRDFLTCINATTGEFVWRSRPPGNGFLIGVDGHLVIMTKKGSLHIAKASPRGYEEVDSIELFEKLTWTPPSFANGRIYVRNSFNHIAAVDIVQRQTEAMVAEKKDPRINLPESKFAQFVTRVEKAKDKKKLLDDFMAQQNSFPILEGDDMVHIVYRGEASDMAIRGDMFTDYEEVPMLHIPATDFYYASFKFEPDAHIDYRFTRNLEEAITDSLNLNKAPSVIIGGEVSEIFMPRCKSPDYLKEPDKTIARGTIDTLEFSNEQQIVGDLKWGGQRDLKVYLPAGYKESNLRYPVLYINHASTYLEVGKMDNTLDNLIGTGKIKPVIAVFIPAISGYEYARSQREVYAKMLIEKLVPTIEKNYRTIPTLAGRAILGGDEAGYSAFFTGFKYPGVFGYVAGQSIWPVAEGAEELLTMVTHSNRHDARFFLDWGKYDLSNTAQATSVVEFSERLSKTLRTKGYAVMGGMTNRGSNITSWRLRFEEILVWMFGENRS